jgi:DNA-binding MarR family transcriptional regulator
MAKKAKPSVEKDAVDAWHLSGNFANFMSRIINRLNARLLEVLRTYKLTNAHYRIAQLLYDEQVLTVGELARRVVIPQPVLSRVLTQMETRNLVQRRANPNDSRFKEIVLTAHGRTAYEAIWPRARQMLDDALADFDPVDRKVLLQLLQRLDKATAP